MKAPLVSIVMPNRNYAELLPQAIESVQAQSPGREMRWEQHAARTLDALREPR